MKNRSALLLALALMISLGACGGEKKPEGETPNTPAVTKEPEKQVTPDSAEEKKPTQDLTVVEQTLFTVGYPEGEGWTYDPDDLEGSDTYGFFRCRIKDVDDNWLNSFGMEITEESASSFRNNLVSEGFDLEEVYLKNTAETKKIGDYAFLVSPDADDQNGAFYYRDEASGMSIYINTSDDGSGKADGLLDNVTFALPDNGNTDAPLPWDGTPFTTEERSVMVGTYNLKSQFIPIDQPRWTYETFEHAIAAVGDHVYLLTDGHLLEYAFDGTSLSFLQELPDGAGYEHIDATPDGTLLLSNFMAPLLGLRDGKPVFSFDEVDILAAAPDGTWGVKYFVSGNDCEKVTLSGNSVSFAPLPLVGTKTINTVNVSDRYIFAGSTPEGGKYCLFVFDHSGNPVMNLSVPDGPMGSITFATDTPNGFIAVDGNMRDIFLWAPDGTYIGTADAPELFGTSYPWMACTEELPDGSFLMVMCQEREDESSDEVLVFRLSGF